MSRNHSSRAPSERLSRRSALQRIGYGIGAAALGSACIPGADRCEAGPSAPPVGPDFDVNGAPSARRLLDGIDTFVVVFMENRSFDHFLGALALDPGYPSKGVVDGLRGTEENEDTDGTKVVVHPNAIITNDGPLHSWDGQHQAFGDGKNDGFVKVNEGERKRDVMAYLDRNHIPVHYALADRYCVCDRWFSSVMGPTWPNRFYMHAATSGGRTKNEPLVDGPPTIWEKLGRGCWSAKGYAAGPAHWYYAAFRARQFSGNEPMIGARIENFFEDARRGTLPNFSLIDPDFWANDLHPPHSIPLGEAFIASVVRAMEESPQWKRSLLVVTYDENGGFYDHVPPPLTADERPAFRQLGFRVPTLVIGPTVRRGQVVSTQLEHVSVAATLRARFGIESLGPRMDAANDLSSCIDPALVGLPEGPMGKLPEIWIDKRKILEAGFPYSSQPWIDSAMRNGHIPAHLIDPRSHEERLTAMLRQIQELDVARVRG